ERYRATLRAKHQVLEVDANDLSNWKMQELILNRAKKDKAIDGIILKLNSVPYSMGELQEIRDSIMDFRSSGKKVVCYMELGGNKDYYLVTACDKVLMNPAGYLSLNGLRSEVSFYKSALDKLGIEADLYHIGKYKSASEIFTNDSMSEPYRESLNSILDDLDEQLVNQIAQALEVSPVDVRKKIDEGPYTAKEADKIGLIDKLAYQDQIKEVREEIFGKRSMQISGKEYGNYKYYNYNWKASPRLAIIYANGIIAPGKSMGHDPLLPEIMGSETMVDAIKKAREDKSIKAIVLRIDSGGGSVFASEVIWRELMLTKGKKPLIVSMGGVAASGGYFIACPGDIILAEPGTITGSIGVIAGKFSFYSLYERIGIKKEILKRGENSDIYTSYKPFSEGQQEIVKRQIQEIYDDFVSKVADGRSMPKDAVEKIAQGRVWTGKQAKEKGLVDELGGIHQAISIAKSKAGLKPNQDTEVMILPKPVPIWQRFLYGYVSLPNIISLSENLTKDRMFFIIPYGVNFE
ncbi:signal peptide peptidase SppA, partial [Candidatus Poribacteria bacterium]|nr:signal peptide peptidase SppA [Candidatus Poribacteria bacterium]